MELYDEGFETEGYQDFGYQRNGVHPKLRIRTSLFSAIEVSTIKKKRQRNKILMIASSVPRCCSVIKKYKYTI